MNCIFFVLFVAQYFNLLKYLNIASLYLCMDVGEICTRKKNMQQDNFNYCKEGMIENSGI